MALTFYPHPDDIKRGAIEERIDILMEAAERYKSIILEINVLAPNGGLPSEEVKKRMVPRDQKVAYNWEAISHVLRTIRDLAEANRADKLRKAALLAKLAEVYEVLRAAKMSKLEAVRLALTSEANQLKGGASQVA